MTASEYNKHFDNLFQKIDRAYEQYAKSFGMTYSSLAIFQYIWEYQPCTQKQLCEITKLPKQTINSIVMSFTNQGYIEALESPEDRRHKTLSLSVAGASFAQKVLPRIKYAEDSSMAQFSAEEQETFYRLYERFVSTFINELNK